MPALVVVAVLLVAGPRTPAADVYVGLAPEAITVAPGDTFDVSVSILQPDAEFNAFDASVRFDPAALSFVPTSPLDAQRGAVMTTACPNTFHVFIPTADSLRIGVSLLCSNTFVTGPGPIYQVRFRAGTTPGTTSIALGRFTQFYRAGLFVRPVQTRAMTVTIGSPIGVGPGAACAHGLWLAPPAPNPRRGPCEVRLDFGLPAPDLVSFDVLDAQGRRVAGREAARYSGGGHRVRWPIPPLASGEYFVRLRGSVSGTFVRRWTVLH